MDQRSGTYRPGAVVWREAATNDLGRTTAFYSELLGWKHHDSKGGHGTYRHFQAADQEIAGCYEITAEMKGVPPHWIQYFSVENVDGAAEAVKANGGSVKMTMDIPNVGRVAYCADPQGAMFSLFRDLKGDGPAPQPPYPVGVFCWETLNTTDKKAAAAFYQKILGWKVSDFHGNVVFGTGEGPMDGVADVQEAPPGVPPHWISHVVVKNLAESRDRTTKLGGQVIVPNIEVPTVGTMAVIADPVGAHISLYEPAPRT
jgi:predicted enzyme related to lactoylglutathione lyase